MRKRDLNRREEKFKEYIETRSLPVLEAMLEIRRAIDKHIDELQVECIRENRKSRKAKNDK